MSTKKIFLVIILLTVTAVLFGEDLEFVTIKKTMLYDNTTVVFNKSRDALFEIDKDVKVKYSIRPHMYKERLENGEEFILGTFIYNDTKYYIDCADLIPANTVDTFDSSFISDLNSNIRKTWVPAYYIKVLQSQDRDTILKLDKHWRDFDPYWLGGIPGQEEEWYERFMMMFPCNGLDIYNSVLVFNPDIGMMIKNIRKTNDGYVVTVKFSQSDWKKFKHDDLNWDSVKEKEFFDMIMCIDGDYMDVYLDDMEHKLTTFALVDQIFLKELKSLVKNEYADLSKIKSFPRRAPKQLSIGEECRVLENLKLRESPGTKGAVITTLEQGNRVTVLETGPIEVIDGVTDTWVKVRTASETEGWCFGLYLRETRFDPTPEELAVKIRGKTEETENVYGSTMTEVIKKGLVFKIILIAGIVVLLGGGVVVVAVKKRR